MDRLTNRLKELRARHDLTQEQLGWAVGVTRQTILAIERGDYSPSVHLALRIARRLETSLEEVFWLEPGSDRLGEER
ncbi:MAG TPA: helix-turn-helix transcriptional regulator [Anaerolineae bacterium]|nr:helix-turn-helix transcriptional regulator [Anaerolineae bacterium]